MKANKGFTLAEMLIALVLVGVIAAMVIPKLLTSTGNRTLVSRVQSTASALESAITLVDPADANFGGTWLAYLNGKLSAAQATSTTAAAAATTVGANGTSGCNYGNSLANQSMYMRLKDGTIVALGLSAASLTTAATAGTLSICIDPSNAAGSQGYSGLATFTANGTTINWAGDDVAANMGAAYAGTATQAGTAAAQTVRGIAPTL